MPKMITIIVTKIKNKRLTFKTKYPKIKPNNDPNVPGAGNFLPNGPIVARLIIKL